MKSRKIFQHQLLTPTRVSDKFSTHCISSSSDYPRYRFIIELRKKKNYRKMSLILILITCFMINCPSNSSGADPKWYNQIFNNTKNSFVNFDWKKRRKRPRTAQGTINHWICKQVSSSKYVLEDKLLNNVHANTS